MAPVPRVAFCDMQIANCVDMTYDGSHGHAKSVGASASVGGVVCSLRCRVSSVHLCETRLEQPYTPHPKTASVLSPNRTVERSSSYTIGECSSSADQSRELVSVLVCGMCVGEWDVVCNHGDPLHR